MRESTLSTLPTLPQLSAGKTLDHTELWFHRSDSGPELLGNFASGNASNTLGNYCAAVLKAIADAQANGEQKASFSMRIGNISGLYEVDLPGEEANQHGEP